MAMEESSVPIIDLSKFETQKEKLKAAAVGLGCFRVINHGIPETILTDMKASATCILDLPSEVKYRNTDVIAGTDYVSPNQLGLLYEGLGIYDATSPDDIRAFCSRLDISSRHLEILNTYACHLHALIVDVASKVAESLGIVGCGFEEWSCHLRMNRYNFTEETIGCYGAHEHTDSSFITIILEDECNDGLEILDSSGNFIAINSVPGTFLVNIGDVGKVWSNGKFHNVKHKVVCKKAEQRVTVALFILAPKDNKIEPRLELIDSEHPKLYRSFDYTEYRRIRTTTLSITGEALFNWAIDEAAATT